MDVGCGYGGLLVTLSPMFPDKHMVGFEIRVKVSDYVNDRRVSLLVLCRVLSWIYSPELVHSTRPNIHINNALQFRHDSHEHGRVEGQVK